MARPGRGHPTPQGTYPPCFDSVIHIKAHLHWASVTCLQRRQWYHSWLFKDFLVHQASCSKNGLHCQIALKHLCCCSIDADAQRKQALTGVQRNYLLSRASNTFTRKRYSMYSLLLAGSTRASDFCWRTSDWILVEYVSKKWEKSKIYIWFFEMASFIAMLLQLSKS